MRVRSDLSTGLVFAVASAAAFGLSGPFAKALIGAGWTPTAAVAARLTGGAVLMVLVAFAVRPNWLREVRDHLGTVVAYGVVPIAGAQLCYYNAVAHLPIAVALLLEYTAPLLVLAYLAVRTRRRPATSTLAGAALAAIGIVGVLDVLGGGGDLDVTGVVWALGAAVCAAGYFLLSDRAAADGTGVHPTTLTAAGLAVGAASIAALGATGALPMRFTTADAVVAGHTMSWIVPVLVLAVFPTAVGYTLGIIGVTRLRAGFASLVGLSEVLFATVTAWLLVGERLAPSQALSAVVVLVGLALARRGEDTTETALVTPVAPTPVTPPVPAPDTGSHPVSTPGDTPAACASESR